MRRIALTLALLTLGLAARAENMVPEANKAWSENAGWLVASSDAHKGLTATANYLKGYLWSENVGWIFFGGGPDSGLHYTLDGDDIGVNRALVGGYLVGYAWGENIGWIFFSAPDDPLAADYAPRLSDEGIFSGYAWSENIGWIDLGTLRRAQDMDADGVWDRKQPDSDGDGIPDAIEEHYGLNPADPDDGALDLDGDGRTNAEEFLAGTKLDDPRSAFRVTETRVAFAQTVLRWTSAPGIHYHVEWADSPAGTFEAFSATVTATELSTESTVTGPTPPAFFRVVAE